MLNKIFTPFTMKQVCVLKKWQNNSEVHPYTCGGCKPSKPLQVIESKLYCSDCGYEQNWSWGHNGKG